MKNADLHFSYSAPVRVSLAVIVVFCVVAARAETLETFCFLVLFCVARFTTFACWRVSVESVVFPERLVIFRNGIKTFVRLTVVRSLVGVVEIRFCVAVRCVELPSRTAAPARATDIAIAITKIRIFFISDKIVSKIAKSEQVKYADLYDFYLTFWGQMADFLVAKRFVLRYYAERFRIVGHMAAYESARQT